MFQESFLRSAKWIIVLADIALITFLSSRMAPVVELLAEDSDLLAFGSVSYAHLLALIFVILAFLSLVFCWYGLQAMHRSRGLAPSERFISAIIYAMFPVIICLEGGATYISFAQEADNPFNQNEISWFTQLVHMLVSAAIVIFHLIATYATARIIPYVISDARDTGNEASFADQFKKDRTDD